MPRSCNPSRDAAHQVAGAELQNVPMVELAQAAGRLNEKFVLREPAYRSSILEMPMPVASR